MKLLLICLLLAGCVSAKTNKIYSHSAIEATAETYKELIKGVTNDAGFVHGCDSLLFTSLAAVGGHSADIAAARKDGKWFRRNTFDCFRTGNSKSTISRDMLFGVTVFAYSTRDTTGLLDSTLDYGIANKMVMGEGEKSRTLLTPQLAGLMARAARKNGSVKFSALANVPYIYSMGKNTGYKAHLEALAMVLDGDIHGSLGPLARKTAKAYYDREPENALFNWLWHKYSDGNFAETYAILNNRKHWPRYRLPTSSDHCEFWLWQRTANNDDWKPCPAEGLTHSGGDFLFVYSLLKRGGLRER